MVQMNNEEYLKKRQYQWGWLKKEKQSDTVEVESTGLGMWGLVTEFWLVKCRWE